MPVRATTPFISAIVFCVCYSHSARGQVFLPGKLTRGHAPSESRCEACHAPGKKGKIEPRRCLSCHKALTARIRARQGYHGKQALLTCAKCHKDHLGRAYDAIRWPGGKESFDHTRTGYPLIGKHRGQPCAKCHTPKRPRAAFVRSFSAQRRQRTMLGLTARCASCHKDPHKGALGARCQSCHDATTFKKVTRFDEHNRTRFPRVGKHATKPCAKCHKRTKKWIYRGLRFDSCAACHKPPHPNSMGQATTTAAPIKCATCHDERGWIKIRFARQRHSKALPLLGAHGRTRCRSCHGPKARVKPKGTRCASCHKDPHKNAFGAACAKCHSVVSWRKHKRALASIGRAGADQKLGADSIGIDANKVQAIAFHNKTRYKLTGKHIVTRCDSCHRQRRGRRRVKVRKPKFGRCSDCHKDPHAGQLTQKGRKCADCHETRGFGLVAFDLEDHAKTKMPLKDGHRLVPCARCHHKRRGAKLRFRPAHVRCIDCHEDPHKGRFRATAKSAPMTCASCHGSKDWHESVFDHNKTRFLLKGAHQESACRSCHRPDEQGAVAFRGRDRRCASCHRDSHLGQFSRSGKVRDCSSCHGSQNFKLPKFAHEKATGFALKGKHATLKCADCHHQVTLGDGKKVRLYRLGSRSCVKCHRPRHLEVSERALGRLSPLVRQVRAASLGKKLLRHGEAPLRRCEDCHDAISWRELKRSVRNFDHAQTGYPLRGAHLGAACGRCHRPNTSATRRCSSCHRDPHKARLGKRCADCHRTTSWNAPQILARHRQTRLPLTGWHAIADCASCHPGTRDNAYRAVPAACIACHAEAYSNPRTHPNHRSVGFGQRCEQCHRPSGWRPASPQARQSQLVNHLRLPLRGSHGSVPCVQCHHQSRPTPNCASCHQKQLRQAQSPNHLASGLSSRCEECHNSPAWQPAKLPPQHSFPLLGQHRRNDCQQCHTDPTRFRAVTCTAACHAAGPLRTRHRDSRAFSLHPAACVRCHPRGRR